MDNNHGNFQETWGWKIYSYLLDLNNIKNLIPGYSDWGKRCLERETLIRRGIVVWECQLQKIGILSASHAIHLLTALRSSDEWKSEGVAITEIVTAMYLDQGKTKIKSIDTAQPDKPKWETKQLVIFRLDPMAGLAFFEYLEKHEHHLNEFTRNDHDDEIDLLARIYKMILGWPDPTEQTKVGKE